MNTIANDHRSRNETAENGNVPTLKATAAVVFLLQPTFLSRLERYEMEITSDFEL